MSILTLLTWSMVQVLTPARKRSPGEELPIASIRTVAPTLAR